MATVEEAAHRAGISRTTAYRYFANQRELLVATYPDVAVPSLLDDPAPDDPLARLDAATERFAELLLRHEPELRAQLRLSLESTSDERRSLVLRQGRAIGWMEEVLAPLRPRLGEDELRRLAIAIRATLGIESLVWLVDVARLPRDEAVELMRSSARVLVEAAIRAAGAEIPGSHARSVGGREA